MKPKNTNAHYYLSNVKSLIANIIVFSIIFVILSLINHNFYLLYGILVIIIGLMPFIIYYTIEYNYYQKVELTDVQVIKLTKIKASGKKFIGFYVTLKVDGHKKSLETKSVFSKLKYAPTFVEPYIEGYAFVGYNAKRNEAVVIKLDN